MRVRFAPSPTGHLHVGNARTALFNWLAARHQGGTFLLRIEDTDQERSTAASEAAILEDLRWLGLAWDEGVEAGGAVGPYRQSERLAIYADHTARLLDAGHAYHCFCSPGQLDADRQASLQAGQPPKYSGRCRAVSRAQAQARIEAGERPAVRLRVPAGREVRFVDLVRGPVMFHTEVIGDPVLVRADGIPAYNYAVVIDDALMGITDVVRGEDHISNTPRQILLYEAFGWTPPRFAHLSLVLGPDHAPLSKRHGATSVEEFRRKGYLPESLVNYLALLGWSPGEGEEVLPLGELARRFDLASVGHSASVFDEAKLAWVNRQYLKQVDAARLVTLAWPHLVEGGVATGPAPGAGAAAWLLDVLPAVASSVDRLPQIPERLHAVFAYDAAAALAVDAIRAEATGDGARAVAGALAEELAATDRLRDREAFRALAARVRDRTGLKGKALFHPIRVALTGLADGPELDLIVPAIDRACELGSDSGLMPVRGCRERAASFVSALEAL
jgi:nondiscriminating glutamyl-tRNA synthetase